MKSFVRIGVNRKAPGEGRGTKAEGGRGAIAEGDHCHRSLQNQPPSVESKPTSDLVILIAHC